MIHILIADDHPLLRDALRASIEDEPDLVVIAEVTNGQAAVQATLEARPDVAILDLYLPDMDGIQALKGILSTWPEAHVLIFTSSTEDEKIVQAIQAGALGYLIKDSQRSEILLAVREVAQGHSYLSPTVAAKLATGLRQQRSQDAAGRLEHLTKQEEVILKLVGEGASNVEIAQALHIGETTVRTHVYHILQKMGFENRSQLLMYLLQQKKK